MTITHEAVRVSSAALPTIDVAGSASPRLPERQAVADELRRACLRNGFFYVSNHGIPDALIAEVLAETKWFFALPLDGKLALDKAHSRANRGYEKLQDQTLEADAPPDLSGLRHIIFNSATPIDDGSTAGANSLPQRPRGGLLDGGADRLG